MVKRVEGVLASGDVTIKRISHICSDVIFERPLLDSPFHSFIFCFIRTFPKHHSLLLSGFVRFANVPSVLLPIHQVQRVHHCKGEAGGNHFSLATRQLFAVEEDRIVEVVEDRIVVEGSLLEDTLELEDSLQLAVVGRLEVDIVALVVDTAVLPCCYWGTGMGLVEPGHRRRVGCWRRSLCPLPSTAAL